MKLVYNVYDDDNQIESRQFDNFPEALAYAKQGLITFICEEDLDCPDCGERIVWAWDSTWNDEEAIASVESRGEAHPETFEEPEDHIEISISGPADEVKSLAELIFDNAFDVDWDMPVEDTENEAKNLVTEFGYEDEPAVKDLDFDFDNPFEDNLYYSDDEEEFEVGEPEIVADLQDSKEDQTKKLEVGKPFEDPESESDKKDEHEEELLEEVEDLEDEELEEDDFEEEIITTREDIKEIAAEAGEAIANVYEDKPKLEVEDIREITDEVVDEFLAECPEENVYDVEDLEKESENLEEHVQDRPALIEIDQELEGTDNAVVDCEVADVITHSEDEKPLDCKMKKAPLEKPLTEDVHSYAANLEAELTKHGTVNVACGLTPCDFGYETRWHEDLAVDVSKDGDTYYVWEYLETEDGPVGGDPEITQEFDSIEKVIDYLVNSGFVSESEIRNAKLHEETHAKYAKSEGDRVAAFNNALTYAKKENKPFIYGYTNHTGKFFALEQPMKVSDDPAEAEKDFRNKYKNCKVVYVVYPDKSFITEAKCTDCGGELKNNKCTCCNRDFNLAKCKYCGGEVKDGKCMYCDTKVDMIKCQYCGGEVENGKCTCCNELAEAVTEDWTLDKAAVASQNALIDIIGKELNKQFGSKVDNRFEIFWSNKFSGVAVMFDKRVLSADKIKEVGAQALLDNHYEATEITVIPGQKVAQTVVFGKVLARAVQKMRADGSVFNEEHKTSISSLEESISQELAAAYREISRIYGKDLNELLWGPEGFMTLNYPNGFEDFKGDIIYSEKYWTEFEKWLDEQNNIEENLDRTTEKYPNENLTERVKVHRPVLSKEEKAAADWCTTNEVCIAAYSAIQELRGPYSNKKIRKFVEEACSEIGRKLDLKGLSVIYDAFFNGYDIWLEKQNTIYNSNDILEDDLTDEEFAEQLQERLLQEVDHTPWKKGDPVAPSVLNNPRHEAIRYNVFYGDYYVARATGRRRFEGDELQDTDIICVFKYGAVSPYKVLELMTAKDFKDLLVAENIDHRLCNYEWWQNKIAPMTVKRHNN